MQKEKAFDTLIINAMQDSAGCISAGPELKTRIDYEIDMEETFHT